MRQVLALMVVLAMGGVAAADGPPSEAESLKVVEVLAGWGCSGGTVEKEDSGVFEVDDANCLAGEYDFHIDQDFTVLVIVRH